MMDVLTIPVLDVYAQPDVAPLPTPAPVTDGVGLYKPSTSTFYLKSYGAGPADAGYTFGPAGAGWQPFSRLLS